MNYYLNVSLISSSTKNDRYQDITAPLREYQKICENFRVSK